MVCSGFGGNSSETARVIKLCNSISLSVTWVSSIFHNTLNCGYHSVHLVSHEVKVLEDNSWTLSTFASLSTQKRRIDARLMSDALNWRELYWNTWGLFYNSVNSSVPATIVCWKLGGFCAFIDMNWKAIWEVNLRLRKVSAQMCFGSIIFTATHLSVCLHKLMPVLNSCFGRLKNFYVSLLFYLLSIPHPLKGSPRRQLWNNNDDDNK